jgi:hypothetical protein
LLQETSPGPRRPQRQGRLALTKIPGMALGFPSSISTPPRPSLIVHHVKDACPSTLFGPAQKLSEHLPAIIVDGPDKEKSDQPCVAGTNGGKEKETLDQILGAGRAGSPCTMGWRFAR